MPPHEKPTSPPLIFMSYSHDDEEHRNWVETLARRLRANGVDVRMDLWDVTLGGNLSVFMERVADPEYRVIVVITHAYTAKADDRSGGVGVEAQMMSADLYEGLESNRVLPIIRNNPGQPAVPRFLKGRRWLDFRGTDTEDAYRELLREIHGTRVADAPPVGPNPLVGKTDVDARIDIRNSPARWQSTGMVGEVKFAYSQNSGNYILGSGECQFSLSLSRRGTGSVYAYTDPPGVRHVGVMQRWASRRDLLTDIAQFDTSSRTVEAIPGDAIVLHNRHGYWALVVVLDIYEREEISTERIISFRYVIQTDRTANFSRLIGR